MKKICILLACIFAFQLFPAVTAQEEDTDILFFDDFEEQDESAWTTENGEVIFIEEEDKENTAYSVGTGDYFQKETMSGLRNYSYSFDLYMDYRDANGQFGNTWPTMRFRASDDSYYHMYLYNREGSEEVGFQKMVEGEESWLATASVPLTEDNETWVSVKISLVGSKIEVYYKDMENPIISYDDVNGAAPLGGSFYFVANSASAFYIDNLKVEETKPEQAAAENITKETDREIYRFYDYENESENENVTEDESGNHYLDISQLPLELGEYSDFICKFNWIKDYKPYGENFPAFSFGAGYVVELDSTLKTGGIVLKKDGEELKRAEILLADYDDVKAAIAISAIGNLIEVYYGDLDTPILTYNAEETIPSGNINLAGGIIDNLYLASAFRYKPIEILSSAAEIQEEQMTVTADAVSHLEEDIAATAIIAAYLPEGLCALSQSQIVFAGNDCNAEEKTHAQIELLIPYIEEAQYYMYIWDGLKPLTDLSEVGAELKRTSMPPVDSELPQITLDAESDGNKISISGKIETDTEQSITILVQKAKITDVDISQAVYLTQFTRPDEDGSFKTEFSSDDLEEGDYTVYATCDDSETVMVQLEYLKPENLGLFMEKLNLTATAEEMRALLLDSANARYARYFGINTEKLAALGQETLQNGVCMRMLADKGEGFTRENAGKIFASHLAFALLKTANDGEGVYALISDNPELYLLDELYLGATEDVKKETCSGIYMGLKTNLYDDLSKVMTDLKVNVILSEIYLTNYKDIPDLLKEHEEEIKIDLSKLDELSATQAANVYQALNENRIYSFETLLEIYDDAINKQTEEPSPAPRPAGGGGGGGGGGNRIRVEAAPTPVATPEPTAAPTQIPEEKTEIVYKDLSKGHWANEAIAFLSVHEPPVISGYDDGCFYPDRYVTRAEFVKLIINAFKFNTDGVLCTYNDVDSDSWYYTYIAAAEQAGVVTGTDNGTFRPDEEISRQDMAVMLHRVLEIKLISLETVTEPVFPDGDTVSVYAQKAVNALGAAGVINGTDGGKLSPFASATRAQAAKMIYEILK